LSYLVNFIMGFTDVSVISPGGTIQKQNGASVARLLA